MQSNYPPAVYHNLNINELIEIVDVTKFSTVIVNGMDVVFAPFYISSQNKEDISNGKTKDITLYGHFAYVNPLRQLLEKGPVDCRIVFNCADGYVTPSVYQKKEVNGEVVPTWNYVAAQLTGEMRLITTESELKEMLIG